MLVIDEYGVKYINKDDITHFLDALQKDYEVDTD